MLFFVTFNIPDMYAADKSGSSNIYDKLAKGSDINILVLGDSIGMGSHASDSAHTWSYQVEQYLENTYGSEVYLNNLSMNGNRSYSEYVRVKTLKDNVNYDLVILCCGQNDKTKDEYTVYYEALIRAVVQRFRGCQIISVLQSSIVVQEKIDSIIGLCSHYDIPVADTIQAFKDSGIEYDNLSADGVHPNDDGYGIYADTVTALVDSLVISTDMYACGKDALPVYEEAESLDNLSYYSAGDFTYDGTTTYDMDVSGLKGTLGIDMGMRKPGCSIKIYADGELVADILDVKSLSRLIRPVAKDMSAGSNIRVVISDTEVAKSFCGIIISGEKNEAHDDSSFEPVPKVMGAINVVNGVKITWQKTKGVKGYAVLRKNYGPGSYHTIGTADSDDITEYTDTTAVSGKYYTYSVRALSGIGKGMFEPGVGICYLNTPLLTAIKSSENIKISWDKIRGADGYVIYRKIRGGRWTKYRGVRNTWCLDENVTRNYFYTYMVRAYRGKSSSGNAGIAGIKY